MQANSLHDFLCSSGAAAGTCRKSVSKLRDTLAPPLDAHHLPVDSGRYRRAAAMLRLGSRIATHRALPRGLLQQLRRSMFIQTENVRARRPVPPARTAPTCARIARDRRFARPPDRVHTQTPNPESLKFIPGKPVLGDASSLHFRTFKEAQASPLAKTLFQTEGVEAVFLANEFITVTKGEDVEWSTLKPLLFEGIMNFYASGVNVMGDGEVRGRRGGPCALLRPRSRIGPVDPRAHSMPTPRARLSVRAALRCWARWIRSRSTTTIRRWCR